MRIRNAFFVLILGTAACVRYVPVILPGTASSAVVSGPLPTPLPPSMPTLIDLSGPWKYLPYNGRGDFSGESVDDSRWPLMRLPSNWFLLGSGDYPAKADESTEKLPGSGELWPVEAARGLNYSGTVWYRRQIEWPGEVRGPVILDLDMVDYYCDVFVNGRSAGTHEGYFQKWSLDVRPYLRRGSNVIALRVEAPALVFDMSQQYPISWPKQQNQVKGIFAYHDTRPGGTSERGQERSTGGVLRGIVLRETTGLDIEELSVTSLDVTDQSARLVIDATVRNWGSQPQTAQLRGEITAGNFSDAVRIPVTVGVNAVPGVTHVQTQLRIANPALWWSWDYGKPNLYRLAARLERYDGGLLSNRDVNFGVRSITRDNDWVWRLNGKRIYPRGSNYISTQWLSQATRSWYERDVALMVRANLNSIRVHAHLERPEFYDVADSLGVMVWQDFPLQWGYSDLTEFHTEALRQAREMIVQYRGHPSIIVWCMHNESPHAMSWMQKRDPKQNLALDDALFAVAEQMDPSRVAHRDSGTGDGHPYPGWYGGKLSDFARTKYEPFLTEYGAQALPTMETMRMMFTDGALWPNEKADWEKWKFHNFQYNETFNAARVKQGTSIEQFLASSQRVQAVYVRYGTEVLRRRKWQGNTGIYHFMFTEDWPSITWAVVDYFRRPKPGYEALRMSMQPVLPSIEYIVDQRNAPVVLWVVNDLLRAFPKAVLRWTISGDGLPPGSHVRALDIPADASVRIIDLGPMPAVSEGHARLDVTLEDASGHILGSNTLSASDFQ